MQVRQLIRENLKFFRMVRDMKKSYETPTVEKISFRYRDQVVAASGVSPQVDDSISTGDRANQVVDYFLNGWGVSSCDRIGDWVGSWFV